MAHLEVGADLLAAVPRRHRDRGGRGAPARVRRTPREARMATATVDRQVVLETQGLMKRFGGLGAVNGVDLVIPRGDLRAIIGPNGAGKTTLFNLITGDIRHDTGHIYFAGEEVSGLPPQRLCRRGMGRTFQTTSIFPPPPALHNPPTPFLPSHHP